MGTRRGVPLSVRITTEIHHKLVARAKADNKSITQTVERILELGFSCHHFCNTLVNVDIKGEKRGVLMAKIAIVKWLLDDENNKFRTPSELSCYILGLQINHDRNGLLLPHHQEKGEYDGAETNL